MSYGLLPGLTFSFLPSTLHFHSNANHLWSVRWFTLSNKLSPPEETCILSSMEQTSTLWYFCDRQLSCRPANHHAWSAMGLKVYSLQVSGLMERDFCLSTHDIAQLHSISICSSPHELEKPLFNSILQSIATFETIWKRKFRKWRNLTSRIFPHCLL